MENKRHRLRRDSAIEPIIKEKPQPTTKRRKNASTSVDSVKLGLDNNIEKKTIKINIKRKEDETIDTIDTSIGKNRDIYDCFTRSDKIYLRTREIQEIKDFIESDRPILHITGNPGTGKTATVLETLSKHSFEYVNYFTEAAIGDRLKKTSKRILVIDEFDKYLQERRQECLRLLVKLRESKKIITISNDLRMGNLHFRAYSSEEIVEILRMKMRETGRDFIDERCLEFLGKKFERTGDLREVFKSVVNAVVGMEDRLEIKDFVNIERRMERGVHQEMINRIKMREKDRIAVYREYLKECEERGMAGVLKGDFDVIYDLIG